MQLIRVPVFYESFIREAYINLASVTSIEACFDSDTTCIVKFIGNEFLKIALPYTDFVDYLVELAEKSRGVSVLDS